MRIVVLGGTGHVGSYLVPALAETGHEVISVSRGKRKPYRAEPCWSRVRQVEAHRGREEKEGVFARRINALNGDVVIDLICFKLESAQPLVAALQGRVQHFLHCGSLWVHGPAEVVPVTEDAVRKPVGTYGIQKQAIEDFLLQEARIRNFPATIIHPGHIVGPGWAPINPAGNVNLKVFEKLAKGEALELPGLGLETLHHVHAADVAQGFMRSVASWRNAVGEAFHIVSPAALTLRGYAASVALWFGKEAALKFLPWEDWKAGQSTEDADATWDHISRSPCASIEKARRMIGYEPRYASLQAIHEALSWLIANGKVDAPGLD